MLSTRKYDDSDEGLDEWNFMTVHKWGEFRRCNFSVCLMTDFRSAISVFLLENDDTISLQKSLSLHTSLYGW